MTLNEALEPLEAIGTVKARARNAKSGALHLALEADGGIYSWQRLEK